MKTFEIITLVLFDQYRKLQHTKTPVSNTSPALCSPVSKTANLLCLS